MSDLYKDKFKIVRGVISKETSLVLFNYLQMKAHVWKTMTKAEYLGDKKIMGGYDVQVPGTWGCYGDIAMDTILEMLIPKVQEATNIKLVPMYSYTRLYKKGAELEKHKDRLSCEISATMNLGGDPWSIFIEPDTSIGEIKKGLYYAGNTKGVEVVLGPGDILLYLGAECEHWRLPFEGNICGQVFLHYANIEDEYAKDHACDGRPHLGLPTSFNKLPIKRKVVDY